MLQIGKAGFACLIAALAGNTSVDAFRLSDTGISGADAVALIEALQKRGRAVRYMNLGANELSNDDAIAIASALKNNTTLLSLDLTTNDITDAGAAAFGEALVVNATLKDLNLGRNNIEKDGAGPF